jgi:hypothetical protein
VNFIAIYSGSRLRRRATGAKETTPGKSVARSNRSGTGVMEVFDGDSTVVLGL